MSNYIIYTDSACDISQKLLDEWGVKCRCLTLTFANGDAHDDHEIPASEFYKRMRAGEVSKTSAINPEAFAAAFEEELKQGNDILYLGFSSGLSTTVSSASIAAAELRETYPERRLIVVDTLAASAGFGLLVYLAVCEKRAGKDIDEVARYIEANRLHVCHWFTVDDLIYLRRGGRISAATQLAGSLLGIKPVMHVDNEGHLINVSKARGRKNSLKAMADRFGELAVDPGSTPIFISHGDCIDDANELSAMLKSRFNVNVQLITDVGPVIGSHSGPGTLALFFLGRER